MGANGDEAIPIGGLFALGGGDAVAEIFGLWEEINVNAGGFAGGVFGGVPDFFAGVRQNGREQTGESEI